MCLTLQVILQLHMIIEEAFSSQPYTDDPLQSTLLHYPRGKQYQHLQWALAARRHKRLSKKALRNDEGGLHQLAALPHGDKAVFRGEWSLLKQYSRRQRNILMNTKHWFISADSQTSGGIDFEFCVIYSKEAAVSSWGPPQDRLVSSSHSSVVH